MADSQTGTTDGRSPSLTLNLPSNNPFRNRAGSPALASPPLGAGPSSPFEDPPGRPVSRNPFLDPANKSTPSGTLATASMATTATGEQKSPTAEDLFDTLTLDDKKPDAPTDVKKDGARPPPRGPPGRGPPGRGPPGVRPPGARRGPPRGENMPPPGRRGPPPGHRPTRSQEDALRARRMQGNAPGPGDAASPQRPRPERRTRRNSESSVADPEKPLTEEEKKAKEERRRERERRHRENKEKKPPNRRMDIIDQLDATSIFGTGLFHHDGPFDALNPHRNRGSSRRAPMQAFPKDSLNNVLGGSGPLNARPDHATFMGNADDEAFKDYSGGTAKKEDIYPPVVSKADIGVFDPLSRGSILHGDETLGLGTSTFLEGTPAARTAIQKREAETAQETVDGGLQRKKSLAQRIRSINRGPRDYPSGRMTNPEGVYASRRSPTDPLPPGTSQTTTDEKNPFFFEFEPKGEENISVRRAVSPPAMDAKSPTSPRRNLALERRATTDAATPEEPAAKPSGHSGGGGSGSGGGLLARVKSLKGSRRPAPPRPNEPAPTAQPTVQSPTQATAQPSTVPGTAV